jgi:integrase
VRNPAKGKPSSKRAGRRLGLLLDAGRSDVREDKKTRAAVRTVMIPDIAMSAVRRLADRGAPGRERRQGSLYGRLINGDRGGYLGYATWRKYLKLAQGYTAAHPDGIVGYTAHELRHMCAPPC